MPYSAGRAATFLTSLNTAMTEFSINTAKRISSFLAQVAVESGELRYTLEIGDGSSYEGRVDLGNTQPGDGPKYKGRGLIQITGRANYAACGTALGLDLIANPSLLEVAPGAARSAAWFWSNRRLNDLADTDKFGSITKRINGGYNNLDQRLGYWLVARSLFSI